MLDICFTIPQHIALLIVPLSHGILTRFFHIYTFSWSVLLPIYFTSTFFNLLSYRKISKVSQHHVQVVLPYPICTVLPAVYTVLYIFRNNPPIFLYSHLNKLQATLTSFIWNVKHSRIKASLLSTAESHSGLRATDILAYYKAAILDQTKSWCKPNQQTMRLQIESTILSSQPM